LSVGLFWNLLLKQLVLVEKEQLWNFLRTQQAFVLAAMSPLKRSSKTAQALVLAGFEQRHLLRIVASAQHSSTA
jgi:hypothetical protein